MQLLGPYNLKAISAVVHPGKLGVYALSRDGFTIAYVGRSDNDLATRIIQSAREGRGYTSFWFAYVTSQYDGYWYECSFFHTYRPHDNAIHPAKPTGTNWECSDPGCAWDL
jgi:hypothetical protein